MIAIMQPTFLPWLGYFAMKHEAESFAYLDSVQFARRSWQQRNRIKTPQGETWLSLSIRKGPRNQKISETTYDSDSLSKIMRMIEQNYRLSPFFRMYWPELRAVMESRYPTLADLNIELIDHLSDILDLNKANTYRTSELKSSGTKAELLANICLELGYTTYLSAPGSKDYIEESGVFAARNIEVLYHNYEHPRYEQLHGDFLPYMSVLDLLFNHGPRSIDILRSGIRTGK